LRGLLLHMVGEQALEPPSYYFTKPAVTPADPTASTCQPPPDGAQRFSRRVRGIASETLKTDTAEPSSAQPPYRMITKRIRFRRATLPRSVSPWCRSSRRRYRKVIVYVDENGKELSALDMHKRAKAGIPQSAVETEKKIENAASDNSTKKASRILSTPSSETRSKRSSVSICTSAASEPSSVAVVCNWLNFTCIVHECHLHLYIQSNQLLLSSVPFFDLILIVT